jgi:Glycosyltransferase family 17
VIWDCFMFRDELDMLEVRLREFESLDVTHVLVESPVTHRGDNKPLHFAENRDRFAAWEDRIVPVDGAHFGMMAPWDREHAQRDIALRVLEARAADDDIVLIADVDEFPPRGYDLAGVRGPVAFRQRLAMYCVDWLYPDLHTCTVAARWGWLKGRSLAGIRDGRYGYPQAEGGWHLTWLGGLGAQREKLRVTCHTEMTQAEYDRIWSGACYERGEHHGGQYQMIPVDVDESWPGMIWRRECPPEWFRPRP